MKKIVIIFILFINLIACAYNGNINEKKSINPRYYIPYEEIQMIAGANNAQDVISRSRPAWLMGRGMDGLFGKDSTPLLIFINGIQMQMGGLDALNSISVEIIKDIKFFTPSEATIMYGTNNMGGIIEIRTR
tara:strand:+ start:131 stop:526 length:396 start_codon:yes stop_codon:yes gene_type:complete